MNNPISELYNSMNDHGPIYRSCALVFFAALLAIQFYLLILILSVYLPLARGLGPTERTIITKEPSVVLKKETSWIDVRLSIIAT
jgi:hypothetical protein